MQKYAIKGCKHLVGWALPGQVWKLQPRWWPDVWNVNETAQNSPASEFPHRHTPEKRGVEKKKSRECVVEFMKADAASVYIHTQSALTAKTTTSVLSILALFAPLTFASVSPLERLRFPRPEKERAETQHHHTSPYIYISRRRAQWWLSEISGFWF